ncbi:hypothetical protein GTR04_1609 [Trichophyton interdigitale]|uniref:Uncharacterized protein n=1 Tax=Trichophyton interdigitale TaxID=101480 RepID=A0A9P4YGD7_9EURO|nr:hypothetical protein GY632_3279 [Trichophyton interdigitale]KAF3898958.1 hypothetical protein GY631_0824 [Trichophyton interdigitale]KAG8210999.1 hypothetical protein GTR04_1609 [Trichophyton interdigitale]
MTNPEEGPPWLLCLDVTLPPGTGRASNRGSQSEARPQRKSVTPVDLAWPGVFFGFCGDALASQGMGRGGDGQETRRDERADKTDKNRPERGTRRDQEGPRGTRTVAMVACRDRAHFRQDI